MARKRYSDEDALRLLREIDVHLHDGLDVVSACRKAGISDKTYYYWRKKFGGMGRPQLVEMRALQRALLRHWSERQWRVRMIG
ncbi:transposase [Roseovarius aestuarii]|uniref:Transposase n=1 Tax=Roseovarius aestuarii TaxID=475083 RepID=A0A1X7BYT9_9RHOB|nr:transposase [Roseovarius aestuarii]SMC14784.1 Transposase [Roseovarius aestuarii]